MRGVLFIWVLVSCAAIVSGLFIPNIWLAGGLLFGGVISLVLAFLLLREE